MSPVKPPPAKDAVHWLQYKFLYSIGFGLTVFAVAAVVLFLFRDSLKPKPDVVRIAYSSGGPARKHMLDEMVTHGRKWNLDIQLVPTASADATLDEIDQRKVEMGLIAGAMVDRQERKIAEITPLYMEPLQLVVKADLYESISKDFGQLAGKSISTDRVNSATDVLSTELLRFIGLIDPRTGVPRYQEVHIPQAQLIAEKDIKALPDAIFQIGGVPSATIARLVADDNYRLVALPFGGSFNLSQFRESESPHPARPGALGLDKAFIEEAVIPAYIYGVLPAVPAADTRTIAARLMLVGSPKVKNDVVQRMLALIMSPDIANIVEPELTAKLLETEFQFPRHPGTDAYVASLNPFTVDTAVSKYQRMAEIWGILVAIYLGAVNAWRWVKEKRDRRETHAVNDFMSRVLEVETEIRTAASGAERTALDQRLTDIKMEAIALHLDGRLEDPESLQSLLVALADTRTQIWVPVV